MNKLLTLTLILFTTGTHFAAAEPPHTCKDQLCKSLSEKGMSIRAYDVMMEMVERLKYKKDTVAIADYSLPSAKERLFVINLAAKTFKAYHASHGAGSGGGDAVVFSNTPHIAQSALGFMRTSSSAGTFGRSLTLKGISKSNSRLNPSNTAVLIHCAEYSSNEFFKNHGYWGRSFGCITVPCENNDEIIDSIGPDALVLSYHEALWDMAQSNPARQEVPGHPPIPPASKWEIDENNHGKAGAPYKIRYKNEPYENALHDH